MTTKRERAEAKERWRRYQRQRALIATGIVRLQKQQGHVTDKQLEDLGLQRAPKLSPDWEFVIERVKEVLVKGVRLGDPQFHNTVHQAFVDLAASDLPLSPRMRSFIADDFRQLVFPDPARNRSNKYANEVFAFEQLKRHLQSRGMTSAEAECAIAKSRNIKIDTLRKKIQRAKSKS